MARKTGITLEFKGFDEMIEKIRSAERDVKPIVDECMKRSAKIQENVLKAEMQSAGVDEDLISRMPPAKVEWDGPRCRAFVGYPKGNFDRRNPDDAHKVIFANYGTPRQEAKNFIAKAKKKARTQINKENKKALQEIIKELEQ